MVAIREFKFPDDYEAVKKLWAGMEKGVRLGRSDTLEEIDKKYLRDPDLFLVAEANENIIIGAVIGGYDGRRGLIYHLAVDIEFRGQGVGSKLLNEVEERLREKGCLKCYLMIASDNREVGTFYEEHGWHFMDYVIPYGKDLQ